MKVWRILVRYGGWRLAVASGCGIAGGAALAAMIRLVNNALALADPNVPALIAQFVGLLAVYFVGTLVAENAMNDASERLQWELRQSLVAQMLQLPLRQVEQIGFARLFAIIGSYVRSIADYVCWLPEGVINLAVVVGCLGYMARLSPPAFLFNLAFVGLAAACFLVPERIAQRLGRRGAIAWEKHVEQMQYAILAVRSLLLSRPRRADFLRTHFRPTGADVRRCNRQTRLAHLVATRLAETVVLANVACLLFVLPRFIDLPVATRTGLLLAAIFVRMPLKSLLDVIPKTNDTRVCLQRITEAGLDAFALPAEETGEAKPATAFRELALEEVSFRFETDHDQPGFTVGPLSLRLEAGEIVFIVGGNGAGKTTLAKLLCGLYPPASGRVGLNGVAIDDDVGREQQRAQFSAVFTEDPLFGHVLGVGAQPEARGNELIDELRLAHKVLLRGTEFSTVDLSQGQRRRLLLVAALLEDRPILLLDEWAADQDPHFRQFFYESLVPSFRARGKTLVLITHDDRYFSHADRVLKVENGRLVPLNVSASTS